MTLLIVDGNNIAHRVNYKYSLSIRGMDVSVTYGFLRSLQSYIKKFNATSVIVCWDGGIPKHRREATPAYKATRKRGEDDPLAYADFIRQMEEVRDTSLHMAGVLSVWGKGVEADDLAYQAAYMASLGGHYDDIVVVSADDDLLQATLLDNVRVYSPNRDDAEGSEYITKTFGIEPNQFVSWKALQGDSSDNIKGVPGIGPKTATMLFNDYNTSTGIFNAAEGCNPAGTIEGKRGEAIRDFGFEAYCHNVKTIALASDYTGARLILYTDAHFWTPFNRKGLRRYFLKNGFVSMIDPDVFDLFARLEAPVLSDKVRMPVICGSRTPVCES